eukprot:scaffold6259_cov75-Skeletonema_marinoi.AAC.5
MVKPSSVRVPTLKSYTVKRKELGIFMVEIRYRGIARTIPPGGYKNFRLGWVWGGISRICQLASPSNLGRGLASPPTSRERGSLENAKARAVNGKAGRQRPGIRRQQRLAMYAEARWVSRYHQIYPKYYANILYSAANSDRRRSRRIYISDNRVLSDSSCY